MDFAAGVYLSEAPSPPMTLYPPPLTHCILVYCILIHTGKGGGGEMNMREGKRGNSSQSRVENSTNMTECISPVYKL